MINREKYRNFCQVEKTIPIFSQAWWLDAMAGENNWDVVFVEKGGEVMASMPFVIRKKYGLTLLTQPPLTQTLGPWIRQTNAKSAKRLEREKDLLQALIEQLPNFERFSQNWNYKYTNWLPFYWAGFEQTTRYTYRLNDLSDEQQLWENLQANIRREIKKAQNRIGLRVRTDCTIDDFMHLNVQVFKRQGKSPPYSKTFVTQLDSECKKRQACQIFIAEDEAGRHHAGVYLIWDESSAYYLMGGSDPALRNSGATSLCMWEAIRFASTVTKSFDFEGSMIEPVERFFRAFGAEQTPYFLITKTPSGMLRFYQALKRVLKR